MAFPSIAGTASTNVLQPPATSSSNATLPSGIVAGEVLFAWQSASTDATRSTPSGWTSLGTASITGSRRVWLFARIATGDSNDNFLMDRSAGACVMGVSIWRVTGQQGTTVAAAVDASAISVSPGPAAQASVTADPGVFSGINFGAKTPSWGVGDTLWILGTALESSNLTNPTNYTEVLYHDHTGLWSSHEVWTRQRNASSEDPPNVGSGGALIGAFFVAVRGIEPSGFSGASTSLAGVVASGTIQAVASAFGAGAALGGVVASGVMGSAPGVLTSQPLKTNNGTLLASASLDYVDVYLESSGVFVGRFTGLSTNSLGVFTVTSALLAPGTAYKLDWRTAAGHRRMPTANAS